LTLAELSSRLISN